MEGVVRVPRDRALLGHPLAARSRGSYAPVLRRTPSTRSSQKSHSTKLGEYGSEEGTRTSSLRVALSLPHHRRYCSIGFSYHACRGEQIDEKPDLQDVKWDKTDKTTTVAHPTTPKSNCAISLPARPSRIGASQADPKRSRERRLPPSISVALRPLFAAVPRIELLCAWAEQQNYELIRPLVLFGGPAAECAEETRAASERTLQRKAKRFRAGGVESLFGA